MMTNWCQNLINGRLSICRVCLTLFKEFEAFPCVKLQPWGFEWCLRCTFTAFWVLPLMENCGWIIYSWATIFSNIEGNIPIWIKEVPDSFGEDLINNYACSFEKHKHEYYSLGSGTESSNTATMYDSGQSWSGTTCTFYISIKTGSWWFY